LSFVRHDIGQILLPVIVFAGFGDYDSVFNGFVAEHVAIDKLFKPEVEHFSVDDAVALASLVEREVGEGYNLVGDLFAEVLVVLVLLDFLLESEVVVLLFAHRDLLLYLLHVLVF